MVVMKNFIYLKDPNVFVDSVSLVVHLSNIQTEDDLLDKLNIHLIFPSYFGFNYNALYDCLSDFHWLKQYRIIIVHDDMPNLDDQTLKIYTKVLYDAINNWKEGEEHTFDVVFPKQYEQKIESLIARMNP